LFSAVVGLALDRLEESARPGFIKEIDTLLLGASFPQ
jgi:hypothetical protein